MRGFLLLFVLSSVLCFQQRQNALRKIGIVSIHNRIPRTYLIGNAQSESVTKSDFPLIDNIWNPLKAFLWKVRKPLSHPTTIEIAKETEPSPIEKDLVIIGAGVSGLACLKTVFESISSRSFNGEKPRVILLEQSNRLGGRVFTENVDGFLLDYGFQVFIDSYPKSIELFNFSALELKKFLPGALVYREHQLFPVFDPFRLPQKLLPSLLSPIGTIVDKLLVGIFSVFIRLRPVKDICSSQDISTKDYLTAVQGLSDDIVDSFFRPFYQGIFLSPLELQSSRMFQFLFKMFAGGSACLPARGIQEIPRQLAAGLPSDLICLGLQVDRIQREASGGYRVIALNRTSSEVVVYKTKEVVIACDPVSAQSLLTSSKLWAADEAASNALFPEGRGVICLYFSIEGPPPEKTNVLILNGENKLLPSDFRRSREKDRTIDFQDLRINNLCFPSAVSPSYAPEGKSLASVSIVGYLSREKIPDSRLETLVRSQLEDWWGKEEVSSKWKLLRIYRIPYAQPAQTVPLSSLCLQSTSNYEIAPGVFLVGDYRANPTLNGALESGVDCANQVLRNMVEQ